LIARNGNAATESAINETHAKTAVTSNAFDSVTFSPDQLGPGIQLDVLIGSGANNARFENRLI
jgi:hypothetical protein